MAGRITSHLKEKSWWNRLLVILPMPGNDSFTSASAGYLEGAIYEHLSDYRFAVSQNNTTPGDDTPNEREKARLRKGVLPNLTAMLRVLGYDTTTGRVTARPEVAFTPVVETVRAPVTAPEPTSQHPTVLSTPESPGARRTRKTYRATISGMVARGYLSDGETIRGKKGAEAKAQADGSLVVEGQVCKSLNKAYKAAYKPTSGPPAQNGWTWFSAERDGRWRYIAELRDEYEAAHPEDRRR